MQYLWCQVCKKIQSIDSGSLDSGMVHIKFANQQKIKKHVDTVLEGIKPFECSICDVKFENNYDP